jgi:hypothetical protein
MKLTAEQIERLYAFTRQHYVEYYDLQTELVDHLANAIEEQWESNPKLTFEEALQMEFKKFGVFGFMEVVDKRKSALNSKYNKLVVQHLKTFFSIPKIIGTLAAIGSVFWILVALQRDLDQENNILQASFLALIVSSIICLIVLKQQNKKRNQKTEKKWLLREIIFGYSGMAGSLNLPIQLLLHLKGSHFSIGMLLFFSFLLVVFGITIYITMLLIPAKADQYLRETYPEYGMV